MFAQDQTPLYAALLEQASRTRGNFHLPGHKQGRGAPPELAGLAGAELFALDLTELAGLDDLHRAQGVIARAQALAAAAYGAEHSFFLVNGATVGIQALLLALGGSGGKVLLPRHCHRSVLGGLILGGGTPVFLEPVLLERFGFAAGVRSRQVALAVAGTPDAVALLTVRPNYYGVADNLAAQAQITHKAGLPLLVDEAHGAHLRFHPSLPADAMATGAAAAVQSTHKFGGSLTQSAMLHLGGGFPAPQAVAGALDLLQTTSPSYLLLASLDLARRQLALRGAPLWERALQLAGETRRRLSQITGLTVLSEEDLPRGWSLDGAKVVVAVDGLGLTGYQVRDLLAQRYQVYLEMADLVNIVAFLAPSTTRRECDLLVEALLEITRRERQPLATAACRPAWPALAPVRRLTPREAWFAPSQKVPLTQAGGRISSEMAALYPPGIPALWPGEEITPPVLEYLQAVQKLGLPCHGPADSRLKTIKVMIE